MAIDNGAVDRSFVVAVIPARGGSKGIRGKNLKLVGGLSLLARAIRSCQAVLPADNVFVSTDDAAIAAEATRSGAQVITRPDELAADTASSEAALFHALDEIDGSRPPMRVLAFVQCTSPFIDSAALERAVDRVIGGTDVVFSAAPTHDFLWRAEPQGAVGVNHDASVRLRRQDLEPEYVETGAFYVMDVAGFRRSNHRFFGRTELEVVEPWTRLEIDDPEDLELARRVVEAREVPSSEVAPALGAVEVLVTDFDGVHTDDTVIVMSDGTEGIVASRSDGFGCDLLRSSGIRMLILSRETNVVVRARAEKLRVECLHGVDDKWPLLRDWIQTNGFDPSRVAYLGNDLNDIECLENVGVPMCVAGSPTAVQAVSKVLLTRRGGDGAVREAADLILDHQAGDRGAPASIAQDSE